MMTLKLDGSGARANQDLESFLGNMRRMFLRSSLMRFLNAWIPLISVTSIKRLHPGPEILLRFVLPQCPRMR